MNLEDIQSTAKSMLDAHAPLATVTILTDDGTWPQTPDREAALASDGVVVVIWQITGGNMEMDVRSSQRVAMTVEMPITIEENRAINLSDTGLGISPDLVVREIISCLAGKPIADPFKPAPSTWANFGNVDGVNQRMINFTHRSII
jgi:hypothetical protein